MVFVSSEPATKPFSAVVAYLTVLQAMVCFAEKHPVGLRRVGDGMKRTDRQYGKGKAEAGTRGNKGWHLRRL